MVLPHHRNNYTCLQGHLQVLRPADSGGNDYYQPNNGGANDSYAPTKGALSSNSITQRQPTNCVAEQPHGRGAGRGDTTYSASSTPRHEDIITLSLGLGGRASCVSCHGRRSNVAICDIITCTISVILLDTGALHTAILPCPRNL